MPVLAAIAYRRGRAIERLKGVMQAIGDKYAVDPIADFPAPKGSRDPLVTQMLELEAFADWGERLADGLGLQPAEPESVAEQVMPEVSAEDEIAETETEGYESMTVAQLTQVADDRQLDLGGAKRKAEIIGVLRAADGLTE